MLWVHQPRVSAQQQVCQSTANVSVQSKGYGRELCLKPCYVDNPLHAAKHNAFLVRLCQAIENNKQEPQQQQ